MSSAHAFIEELRGLHAKAKKGALSPVEKAHYTAAKQQLARLVMVAQQVAHAGKTLRSTFRMAKVLKVELRPKEGGDPIRATTIDVATGGFAALLPIAGKVGKAYTFALTIPGGGMGGNTVTGNAVVASSRPQGNLFRVSLTFDQLAAASREQLDFVLIDALLEQFSSR